MRSNNRAKCRIHVCQLAHGIVEELAPGTSASNRGEGHFKQTLDDVRQQEDEAYQEELQAKENAPSQSNSSGVDQVCRTFKGVV